MSSRVKIISIYTLTPGLIFFISWLFNYSWTIIITPYPAEYREGAMLLMTDFLIHGINPFSLENHPLMNNNYGFLYNFIVLPFATLFGNTLAVHRSISILFVFLSCALVVLTLVKTETITPFALAGGGLVLACLLFSVTPLARPDGLGEFLFLAAILFPWYRNFDTRGLVLSGAFGILAFLAKPYFLLSLGIVASYLFLFVSKKKGLFFGITVLIFLFFVILIINVFFECYFLDVIFNNRWSSSFIPGHLRDQSIQFTKMFLPCIAISLMTLKKSPVDAVSKIKELFRTQWLDLNHANQPLCLNLFGFFEFFFLWGVMAIIYVLGGHPGAYMTYFFQLITPAFILVVFQQLNSSHHEVLLTSLLTLLNLFLICFWVLYPNKLPSTHQRDWEDLYQYVAELDHILNSPVLVSEMIRLGKIPVDSGQSEYYFLSKPYPPNLFVPDYEKVNQQGQENLASVRTTIQHQKYDRLIITMEMGFPLLVGSKLIEEYYTRVKLLRAAMPQSHQYWLIEVWEPKK